MNSLIWLPQVQVMLYDVISNEEIMNALPVLFRTARNESLNEETLIKLVSTIKKDLR